MAKMTAQQSTAPHTNYCKQFVGVQFKKTLLTKKKIVRKQCLLNTIVWIKSLYRTDANSQLVFIILLYRYRKDAYEIITFAKSAGFTNSENKWD